MTFALLGNFQSKDCVGENEVRDRIGNVPSTHHSVGHSLIHLSWFNGLDTRGLEKTNVFRFLRSKGEETPRSQFRTGFLHGQDRTRVMCR